ncbi:hypothetical protein GCM10009789_23910 [Kribbella sancticallisti]|uniref:Uncharacterized protein n=1 Tax=Kribbella sancticallisti TaxID=460087 RepID=A0ABN2D3D4_9ACTN
MTSTDGLQRRTVLAGALAGTAVLAAPLLDPADAKAAPPSTPTPPPVRRGITSIQGRPAARLVHGPDGSAVQMPADLGVELTVAPGGVPAGAALILSYDSRLYSVAPRPVLVHGSQLIALESRSAAFGATHGRQLEFRLPQLPPGQFVIHAGGLAPDRYPADLVADPQPVGVQVAEPGGAITARVLSKPAAKAGLPWGVRLGAGWQQTSWDAQYYAWYPALVTAHAGGPGVIPAGSRIRITLDRRVFESVTVSGAADSLGRKVTGLSRRTTRAGQLAATWTAHSPVAAGGRITLTCKTTVRELTGALDDVEAPLVEFLPPKAQGNPQRLTGEESLTRFDNVYSPASRAQYGPS